MTGSAVGRPMAEVLGERAAGIDERRAPEAVRQRLRAVVVDVLATALASAGRPDVAAARAALLAGDGPSTVIGDAAGAAPAMAALVNGLPIASEQRQDGHRSARGHPGSHVVPAVLAVAEAVGAPGGPTLSAMLAGYEVGVRIGVAMGGTPPGVHDIATWGTIGAAAGVAHLLSGGNAVVVTAAVEVAAATPVLPHADTVFGGGSAQHLFLGLGAQAGVVAGQAAAAGLRALPGTLEGHFGRWSAAAFGPDRSVAAGEWAIVDGYVKRHPTCAHLHGINDAVEDLVAQRRFEASEILAVDVGTYSAAAAFADPRPGNDLAARFSIPWTVAVGLTRGGLDGSGFGPEDLADRSLQDLAARVRVRADPHLEAGYPAGRPAAVTVHLRDGATVSAGAQRPRGDGPEALADPEVAGKPRRLLEPRFGAARVEALVRAVERLPEDGLEPLAGVLRGPNERSTP